MVNRFPKRTLRMPIKWLHFRAKNLEQNFQGSAWENFFQSNQKPAEKDDSAKFFTDVLLEVKTEQLNFSN